MSYLEMAKQAEARLRAEGRWSTSPDDRDEVRKEVIAPEQDTREPTSLHELIEKYREILSRRWMLNISPSHPVDREDASRLLAEQAWLCDEIGPEFAAAVSRPHARWWAKAMGRCPWCGEPDVFHDPETGGAIALPVTPPVMHETSGGGEADA